MKAILTGGAMAMMMAAAGPADRNYLLHAADTLPGCKTIIGEGDEEQPGQRNYCAVAVAALLPGNLLNLNHSCRVDIPTTFTIRQGALIVVRYIEARPERMQEPFFPLAIEALRDAWPCRK
jgi:hypothetical protein